MVRDDEGRIHTTDRCSYDWPPLYSIVARVAAIQNKWPNSTPRTIMAHLEEECAELREALDDQIEIDIPEEAADIALLLHSLALRQGFDLHAAMDRKLRLLEAGRYDDKISLRRANGDFGG